MARSGYIIGRPRSLQRWISVALITFGLLTLLAIGVQTFSSQHLIEHRYWIGLLQSLSADHAARIAEGQERSLPREGIIQSWYLADGSDSSELPEHLKALPVGTYSTEAGYGYFEPHEALDGFDSLHVLVSNIPGGRLITAVDITELENQQNRDALFSAVWFVMVIALVGTFIVWLHANLVRPVRDLAERMQGIDPGDVGARLPTRYMREELQVIAQASNAHLERVQQFVERERSLLDQASHEFRTPIAVISGAVDLLTRMPIPPAVRPALDRIGHAVGDLSETMVALLFLAREPDPDSEPVDVTLLHEFLPGLIADHQHLLEGKTTQLVLGTLEPACVAVPDAMVRIAVSNLLRNAIENTESGQVELSLRAGVICVTDSGSGFDPEQAARRYRENLQRSSPARGQGLGLFLIGRICDRFGWTLSIDNTTSGGTLARLDVNASIFVPED